MSVQIDVSGWRIESYSQGWVLGRLRVRQSGKREGETYLAQETYYPRFEQVVKALTDAALRESDATSLEDLRRDLDGIQAELSRLLEVKVREPSGSRRRREA